MPVGALWKRIIFGLAGSNPDQAIRERSPEGEDNDRYIPGRPNDTPTKPYSAESRKRQRQKNKK